MAPPPQSRVPIRTYKRALLKRRKFIINEEQFYKTRNMLTEKNDTPLNTVHLTSFTPNKASSRSKRFVHSKSRSIKSRFGK